MCVDVRDDVDVRRGADDRDAGIFVDSCLDLLLADRRVARGGSDGISVSDAIGGTCRLSEASNMAPEPLWRVVFVAGELIHVDQNLQSCCSPMRKSGAAHTDIMENSEQVFDEPLAWRHSGQQGQRVRIRSDGSSLLDLPRS